MKSKLLERTHHFVWVVDVTDFLQQRNIFSQRHTGWSSKATIQKICPLGDAEEKAVYQIGRWIAVFFALLLPQLKDPIFLYIFFPVY